MTRLDVAVTRLSWICILMGKPPLWWFDKTAAEFHRAVRERVGS